MFFLDKELGQTLIPLLKIIHTPPPKRAAKHNLSSIKKSSHENIPKIPYGNILL